MPGTELMRPWGKGHLKGKWGRRSTKRRKNSRTVGRNVAEGCVNIEAERVIMSLRRDLNSDREEHDAKYAGRVGKRAPKPALHCWTARKGRSHTLWLGSI